MSHALVTGGSGFIGSNLCSFLLDKGISVTVVDNCITSTGEYITSLETNPNFKFFRHDIVKPFSTEMDDHFKTVDIIFHLACPTGVPNLIPMAEEMLLTCSTGTVNILELARKNKSKLLFTSSSEVYGDPLVFPQTEMYTGNVDPIGIRSPYEEGKRFSESLVIGYVRKYELDAKIVRIFNTYGPNAAGSETRIVPKFIKLASVGKPLPVEGAGKQTRTFCYVDDLVSGLILVANKGKKGEVYNIGSDREVTVEELAKLVLKISGSNSTIEHIERPAHDHNRRLPSLTKIKELGWEPKTNLELGIKKTLDWYKYAV